MKETEFYAARAATVGTLARGRAALPIAPA